MQNQVIISIDPNKWILRSPPSYWWFIRFLVTNLPTTLGGGMEANVCEELVSGREECPHVQGLLLIPPTDMVERGGDICDTRGGVWYGHSTHKSVV